MKAVIIYYSYSGNTKKIAEMVQRETGFMPEILPLEVSPEEYDTVFLGMPKMEYGFNCV